jgi:hypothetical protein
MGTEVDEKVSWWVFVLPAAMSLVALADLPYGYYQLLRIVVAGCAGWIAYASYRHKNPFGVAVFGALAALFNPIVKIHMERDIHVILNVAAAIILIGGLSMQSRKFRESDHAKDQ